MYTFLQRFAKNMIFYKRRSILFSFRDQIMNSKDLLILPGRNLRKVASFSPTLRVTFRFRNALSPSDNQISWSKDSTEAESISVATSCNSKKKD